MNIGINGMGRIGRTFFRVLHQNNQLHKLKAINDIMPKTHLAYLLQHDTVRGKLLSKVNITEDGIEVDGHFISVSQCDRPENIPWKEAKVSIAVECTGVFAKTEDIDGHIRAGAVYCLLTTSGEQDLPMFILGVNDLDYNGEHVFSIGSCTVNGTAPLIKVLQLYTPKSVYINVIHAYSSRQNILDSYHPELKRSRAAADNIIPLNINLNVSLQRLFPVLQDRISSMTSRVPVPCGVLTDLTFMFETPPKNISELLSHLKQKQIELKGIMDVSNDPIVSSDIINNTYSLVIDTEFVQVMDNHVKLLVWFDNEWGFSNRLFEWTKQLSSN